MFKKLYHLVNVQLLLAYSWKMAKEENGASSVEYAVIVAAIAAVIVTTAGILGGNVSGKLQEVADAINPPAVP